jgi:hypothetical protein
MARCIVLNATDVTEWTGHRLNGEALMIPAGQLSRVLQPDRETAEAEAERLARKTGQPFAVLEAVSLVKPKTMPTHATLGGTEIGLTQVPTWTDIRSEL